MRIALVCLVSGAALLSACSPKPAAALSGDSAADQAQAASDAADQTADAASTVMPVAAPAPRPLTPDSAPPPERKAGLWSVATTVAGGEGAGASTQICLDAATDRLMGLTGRGMGRGARGPGGPGKRGGGAGGGGWAGATPCPQTYRRTATGYTIDSVCQRGARSITTHAVASGDFAAGYKVDVSTRMDPPREDGPAERDAVITARWQGPCKPGQNPGDVIRPDGAVFNITQPADGVEGRGEGGR